MSLDTLQNIKGLPIIHSDDYVCMLPPKHRFPMPKFKMIMDILCSDQVVDRRNQVLEPRQITSEEAASVHTPTYIEKFFTGTTSPVEQRATGFEWSDGLLSRVRLETGGTVLASKVALQRGLACSTGGGTHHAFPDRGAGFCLINDIAIAARLSHRKVLIVDLDVHQGDGTALIFQQDPSVFTFSMHAEKNFPFRKQRSDLDVALASGMGDIEYMKILQEHLEDLFTIFNPELVIYDAGVDPHKDDELGKLALTDEGLLERDKFVLESALRRGVPAAAVIGGGYSSDLVALARRHSILHRAATHVWKHHSL